MKAYDHRLHAVRGYPGAQACAANIRKLTEGSELLERPGKKVQDAYSLRSCPQVVGAARDLNIKASIVVRMEGTNVELGRKILAESGFNFTVADGMRDAAEKVVELAARQ